jgi:acyl-CoA thioesterase-1
MSPARLSSWSLLLLASVAVLACSSESGRSGDEGANEKRTAPSASRVWATRPRIVVLGDSLTAGYGIGKDQAYPAALQSRLDAEGYRYEVVNAGVSGDTSAGGLGRLDWSLDGDIRILIVALGANDGLRGLPTADMRRNLETIIERAQQRQIQVLLAGMEALTNLGPQYRRSFHNVFPELARQFHTAFMPFLLEGVAGQPQLNQPDGVHPTAEGARAIADHMWPILQPMLKER